MATKILALGHTVLTRGVYELLQRSKLSEDYLCSCIMRHATGDFGIQDPEDQKTNAHAFKHNGRVLSAYPLDPALPCKGWGDNTLWIITEWDRSVTTALLPNEY